jgi:hypothetical protein
MVLGQEGSETLMLLNASQELLILVQRGSEGGF